MVYNEFSNKIGEITVRYFSDLKVSMLDGNNLVWKIVDGIWIGKRSVYTFDRRALWLEDTTVDNIKSWWCGQNADYLEKFYH